MKARPFATKIDAQHDQAEFDKIDREKQTLLLFFYNQPEISLSQEAILALADGTVFKGKSFGADTQAVGEVVFNTSMTGYQEILTDPSYARQLVTLTYPHIGNTGTNTEDVESRRIFSSGLIVRHLPKRSSNWRCKKSLSDYLKESNIPAIWDIDTRQLTRLIREKGAQSACLMAGSDIDEQGAIDLARAFPGMQGLDLAREVSIDEPYSWSEGGWSLGQGYQLPGQSSRFKVAVYDFGIKHNILRLLAEQGCELTVYPAQTDASVILEGDYQGVFLSNGPGDPEPCDYAIEAISTLLDAKMPMFGICLGHQLLALASGATTTKMKFGHHGANHPVKDIKTGQVVITSQNHGFAVSEDNLPDCLEVTHRSLFDGTNQGLQRRDRPAFSFQGHPEASPGPHDIQYLFEKFSQSMLAQR